MSVSCKYHPTAQLIEDYKAGDLICTQCGLVVGDRVIDVGPEWRVFSEDTGSVNRSRVGKVEDPLSGDASLRTFISTDTKSKKYNMKSLIVKQNKQVSALDPNIAKQFSEIANIAEKLNLVRQITMTAQRLYQKIVKKKLIKIKSNNNLVAACIYYACRQENVPRSFKEICGASSANKTEIGRLFKRIEKALGSEISSVTPDNFIPRYCSSLCTSDRGKNLALQIAVNMTKLEIVSGRSPISLAAAAICIAILYYGETLKLQSVATISGASEPTIKQVCKAILPHLNKVIPDGKIPPQLIINLKSNSLIS